MACLCLAACLTNFVHCQVEERLLEQHVWSSRSPLFKWLNRQASGAGGKGAAAAAAAAAGAAVTPPRTTSPAQPRRLATLPPAPRVVLRKVLRLAADRTEAITSLLGLENRVVDEVWTALQHSLRNPSQFMRDRHLDQLIICTVYAVAKVSWGGGELPTLRTLSRLHSHLLLLQVNRIPMKFQQIIHKYQRMVGPVTRVHSALPRPPVAPPCCSHSRVDYPLRLCAAFDCEVVALVTLSSCTMPSTFQT